MDNIKKTDNAVNIITAMTYKGVANAWVFNNLRSRKTVEQIVDLINNQAKQDSYISVEQFNKVKTRIKAELNELYIRLKDNGGFKVTAIGDDDFPTPRPNVSPANQPVVLFYIGDLSLLSDYRKNVAVIGVLNPSERVEAEERKVVRKLVENEAVIVSGLAMGCDSIAHEETLINRGKTIAVLPSSLDNILPKANYPLAMEILEHGGLLVTEYYSSKLSSRFELSKRYIDRDRLQAMFSNCVVLSASYDENKLGNDCGSRHALAKAKQYGIRRAVIYNEDTDKTDPMFDLSRKIIKEDGVRATIITRDNIERKVLSIIKQGSCVQGTLM